MSFSCKPELLHIIITFTHTIYVTTFLHQRLCTSHTLILFSHRYPSCSCEKTSCFTHRPLPHLPPHNYNNINIILFWKKPPRQYLSSYVLSYKALFNISKEHFYAEHIGKGTIIMNVSFAWLWPTLCLKKKKPMQFWMLNCQKSQLCLHYMTFI